MTARIRGISNGFACPHALAAPAAGFSCRQSVWEGFRNARSTARRVATAIGGQALVGMYGAIQRGLRAAKEAAAEPMAQLDRGKPPERGAVTELRLTDDDNAGGDRRRRPGRST